MSKEQISVVYPPLHKKHSPEFEIFNGNPEPHQEVPGRIDRILEALDRNKIGYQEVSTSLPAELLLSVHGEEYLDFLDQISRQLEPEDANYPSVFPTTLTSEVQQSNLAIRHGFFAFDMFTPIRKGTFEAALASASTAYEVAKNVYQGDLLVGYALCRPPGHHAERMKMGGYCYLSNAGIAAEFLSEHAKVAVLDIDFHHGNGTQDIFYERQDVLTVSIHADPTEIFPYYCGYDYEKGMGQGLGYNLNYPLPLGTDNQKYLPVLDKALEKISKYNPDYLVVGLGLDTHIADPIGGFRLTTDFFGRMGEQIKSLQKPTVITQEGGYNTEILGDNVVAFLQGFQI